MIFGRYTNEPKHKMIKPRFWTARWAPRPAPEWVTPILKSIIAVASVVKGIDLAVDPTTDGEVFAYANIFGTHAWGSVQAIGGALVLLFLALRWRAGLIISLALSMVIWGMYTTVLAQAVFPILSVEGGLRSVAGAGAHCATFVLAFMVSVHQYRAAASEGDET